METKDKEYLKLGSHKITGNVRAVTFKDGEYDIIYIPSLNLSAYGSSVEEATDMLQNVVLKDFCFSIANNKNKGLVIMELKKLGWIRDLFFEKDLSKKAYIDKEGILSEFELPEGTEIREESVKIAC
ncbi:hypothetical protein KO02_16735 [Sphingobacterium sp. ML3W]|uniref:hypothetical protein n=1 Tax=Sphingobacterium sp. ML3W TaxID=1538644 RepID=UPI0004F66981|nr:hypothetical protein [Sphingobacterium sp. ML3W]AIM38139.1 hypothetical protein KO02_16735 [Sphingobacterium sp. ML3W]